MKNNYTKKLKIIKKSSKKKTTQRKRKNKLKNINKTKKKKKFLLILINIFHLNFTFNSLICLLILQFCLIDFVTPH